MPKVEMVIALSEVLLDKIGSSVAIAEVGLFEVAKIVVVDIASRHTSTVATLLPVLEDLIVKKKAGKKYSK